MRFITIFFLIQFYSCSSSNKNRPIEYFILDYSNDDGFASNYSVKIDNEGLVSLKKDETCFTGQLSKLELNYIDSLMKVTKDSVKQKQFLSDKTDQNISKLLIKTKYENHSYLVYGNNCPNVLSDIFIFLKNQIEPKRVLQKSNCNDKFESSDIFIGKHLKQERKYLPPE